MKLQRGMLIAVIGIAQFGDIGAQDRDRLDERSATVPSMVAWEILDKTRSDTDEKHRQQAVLAGGAIGPTVEAVKFVGGALSDKSTLVRQTAVTVLGELKLPEAVPYLTRALDDNPEVSFAAARALCERNEATGCVFLQEVLKGDRKPPDKPGIVQKNVKYAKKKLTPAELAMMGVREAAGVILGPASLGIVVGEEALKAQTTKGSGESGRAIAAATLGAHSDDYARVLLEWALEDPHAEVRAAAARGLAECGNADSIAKLHLALRDQNVAVRCMAAAAVIRLSPK